MKTFKVALLFCAVFSVNGKPADEDVSEDDGRIIGGYPISNIAKEAPYQCVLLRQGSPMCGCSIISRNRILTAAHCVYESVRYQFSIRVGSINSLSGGEVINVSNIRIHPKYNSVTIDNDVAVLLLQKSINMGSPIALATSEPLKRTSCRVSGWGYTYEGGKMPSELRAVDIAIVDRRDCESVYGKNRITSNMICASGTGKDACQGDSGGPLVAGNMQIGIVSWGAGCARPNLPGVYTRIDSPSIKQFIDSTW